MILDHLLDQDGDIIIEDGDVLLGDATYQTVGELSCAVPGEYRLDPTAGADVQSEINDDGSGGAFMAIKTQLQQDGARLENYKELEEGLVIDAKYL